jgi:hypothetical protein
VSEVLKGKVKKGKIPKFWDGHTAERVARVSKKRSSDQAEIIEYPNI